MPDAAPLSEEGIANVDAETLRAAEARLDALIEAEVKHRTEVEMNRMDPAAQAALDAAQKDSKAALDAARNLETKFDASQKAAQDNAAGIKEIKDLLVAQQKAAQDSAASALNAKAAKVALLRSGMDSARVKPEEVTRLAALGEAALDDQLQLLTQSGVVAPMLTIGVSNPNAEVGADGIRAGPNRHTVVDWSKVQRSVGAPEKDMGRTVTYPGGL